MLTVLRVYSSSDVAVVGCEFDPHVLLLLPDRTVITDEVYKSTNPINGFFLKYKWYRIQSDTKVDICSVHPTEQATMQCVGCVKAKIPVGKSYHCSPKCFFDAWPHHRALHKHAACALNYRGDEEDEQFVRSNSSGYSGLAASQSNSSLSYDATSPNPLVIAQKNRGETWFEVGYAKTYTPTADDIGHVLKFECFVVDAETNLIAGNAIANSLLTSRVIPAPYPTPRRLISISGVDMTGHLDVDGCLSSSGPFTVLSYNILADAHATNELFSYCPSWALSWPYRRQNLLREIVGYRADIVCLQEVQKNHFEEFFAPELDKHGYQALFKRKTAVFNGNGNVIDGCATFFRKDRFSLVKKYEVELNKAAESLIDALIPNALRRSALNRLLKDNIALIVVLEAKFTNQGADKPSKRQLVCVANTHLNTQQDLHDVKIWQVHTLLRGLEKIASTAENIPILVCGDFNSLPGSAPHALLTLGEVDHMHQELNVDPLGILRSASKLSHHLPLVSAYSSLAKISAGLGFEQQMRRMNPNTNEPFFTYYTRDFIGTPDYIFYSADSLTVESLLELVNEDSLKKDTALPSPEWSSNHIALLAEFRCKPQTRCG